MRATARKAPPRPKCAEVDASVVSFDGERTITCRVRGKGNGRDAVADAVQELDAFAGRRIIVTIDIETQAADVKATNGASLTLQLLSAPMCAVPSVVSLRSGGLIDQHQRSR